MGSAPTNFGNLQGCWASPAPEGQWIPKRQHPFGQKVTTFRIPIRKNRSDLFTVLFLMFPVRRNIYSTLNSELTFATLNIAISGIHFFTRTGSPIWLLNGFSSCCELGSTPTGFCTSWVTAPAGPLTVHWNNIWLVYYIGRIIIVL